MLIYREKIINNKKKHDRFVTKILFIVLYKPPLKKKHISSTNTCMKDKKIHLNGNLNNILDNGTDSCQIMWN